MSSLDEIKKKLNIEEMDKSSRKEMFNKFVEKGGKVIKEKSKTQPLRFNRTKQIEVNEKLARQNELIKQKYRSSPRKQNTETITRVPSENRKYSFMQFIRGFLSGTFALSKKFNKKFTKNVLDELSTILSSLNFICSQFVSIEPEQKWKMVDYLNSQFSLSYEILMRFYDLYRINSLTRIQNYFKNVNHIECTEVLKNILSFYRDLVILYPYWETSKEQLWKAISYQQNSSELQPPLPRSKINRYIDKLFDYYLPHLHTIITYNENLKLPYELEYVREYLKINAEEDIGSISKRLADEKAIYLAELEKEKEERKKVLKESVEKKEMDKIPKYIQKGLAIIDAIIDKIPEKLKEDKQAQLFEANEKMLYFYYLFNEFDKEYSFLLTSSQLKLTSRLESGVRTDLRSDFDETFIKFNEIANFIREYIELMEEYHNLKIELEDSPLVLQQKIASQNLKRTQLFNEIRSRSIHFFKKFSISLQKLINDYRQDRLLLQNPEDPLQFTLGRGTRKKFQNVPIIKAIAAAFSFSSAFHYYLSFDALSQKSLYLDKKTEEGPVEDELAPLDKTEEKDPS
ncbi:MAG: hypothetical protein MJB14_04105 [Spirochaetes bacterium]|nr:hypothetical protein [Spirochaetota bacterium]